MSSLSNPADFVAFLSGEVVKHDNQIREIVGAIETYATAFANIKNFIHRTADIVEDVDRRLSTLESQVSQLNQAVSSLIDFARNELEKRGGSDPGEIN